MHRVLILITEIFRSKLHKKLHKDSLRNDPLIDSADDQSEQYDVRVEEASSSVYFTSPLSTSISISMAKSRSSASWMNTSSVAEWTSSDTGLADTHGDANGNQQPFDWIPSFFEYEADGTGMHLSNEHSSQHELFLSQDIARINDERQYIINMLSSNKTAPCHRRVIRYDNNDSAYYYRPEFGGKLDDICHSRLRFTAFVVKLDSVLSVETDVVLAMENVPKNVRRKYRARASNNLHKRRPRARLRSTEEQNEIAKRMQSDIVLRLQTDIASTDRSRIDVRRQRGGTNSHSTSLFAASGTNLMTVESANGHVDKEQLVADSLSLASGRHIGRLRTTQQPNTTRTWTRKVLGWSDYIEAQLHRLLQRKSPPKRGEYRLDISRSQLISSSFAISSTVESRRTGLLLSEESRLSMMSKISQATARIRNFLLTMRLLTVSDDPCFNVVAHESGSFFASTPASRSFDD
ncbi:hypothetical protein V1517DRAFT_311783 [Lipomyces orientalis]|uniref:Uncharacterized protein n=1 Tax=Lipomyces orientalis TaxID=1233043 RepID=A0ACC3TZY6_9ASCO